MRHRPTNHVDRPPRAPFPLRPGTGRRKGEEEQRQGEAHRRKIGFSLLLLLAACGSRNQFINPTGPAAAPKTVTGPPVGLDAVWILERSGASPPDTTVTFLASAGRTIVMRHGAPDNAIFAILEVPPAGIIARKGDSVTFRLSPSAGRYGVSLETTDSLAKGVRLTFFYAIHFQEPSEATLKYPTPGQFEQATAAGHTLGNNQLQFVVSERPAADMIRFPVTASGVWLLAARR